MVVIHLGINLMIIIFWKEQKEFVIGTIGESTKNKSINTSRSGKYFPALKFNILSNVPNAARYLKNFDIFVLPSLKEGLPYVILEAGLAGLPVIASMSAAFRKLLKMEKKVCLFLPPIWKNSPPPSKTC